MSWGAEGRAAVHGHGVPLLSTSPGCRLLHVLSWCHVAVEGQPLASGAGANHLQSPSPADVSVPHRPLGSDSRVTEETKVSS